MPRGSDAEEAGKEFRAKTGMSPNAETMILANAGRMSRELRAANRRPVDQGKTKELEESDLESYLEGGREPLDWAVRGPFLVIVSEDDEGNMTKEAFVLKGQEKKAERALGERKSGREEKREEKAEEREEKKEAQADPTAAQARPASGRGRSASASSS